jgi:hypothetical protein
MGLDVGVRLEFLDCQGGSRAMRSNAFSNLETLLSKTTLCAFIG